MFGLKDWPRLKQWLRDTARTLAPLFLVLLVVAGVFVRCDGSESEFAWRKSTRPETGSIAVTFPVGVAKLKIKLLPSADGQPLPHIILTPSEAGIEAFWLKPDLATPLTDQEEHPDPPPNQGKKTPEKGRTDPPPKTEKASLPPSPPPWIACTDKEQKPKQWTATCALESNDLTLERVNTETRATVWLLPVGVVKVVRAVPRTDLWWTRTSIPEYSEISSKDCAGFDEKGKPKNETEPCVAVRNVFGEPSLERTSSATRALAEDIERYEHLYGERVLMTMKVVVGILLVFLFGALSWNFKTLWRGNIEHAEAARLFREVRWPLQWAEVVFPAVAFTLTTASLVVAFRRPEGTEGESMFREHIGFALVATALGLVIRFIAHSADRFLENAAHHGTDVDGIVRQRVSADPPKPTPSPGGV